MLPRTQIELVLNDDHIQNFQKMTIKMQKRGKNENIKEYQLVGREVRLRAVQCEGEG